MISTKALSQKVLQWQKVVSTLKRKAKPVVQLAEKEELLWIDLSGSNPELAQLNVVNTEAIDTYIQEQLQKNSAAGAIGGYMENRLLYLRSAVFGGTEHRTLHLGVDLWLPAGTPIFAVLAGKVHSYADNANFGDYGPTIILEHQEQNLIFYSLYGHLNRASLKEIYEGMPIEAGQLIALLGDEEENGNWPPHLHFQLMLDLEERNGDFPGVAAPSHQVYYEQLCPNPNILLGYQC